MTLMPFLDTRVIANVNREATLSCPTQVPVTVLAHLRLHPPLPKLVSLGIGL